MAESEGLKFIAWWKKGWFPRVCLKPPCVSNRLLPTIKWINSVGYKAEGNIKESYYGSPLQLKPSKL